MEQIGVERIVYEGTENQSRRSLPGTVPGAAGLTSKVEECLPLKSKFQVSILAVLAAALMPLAAAGQIAPERPPSTGPADAHIQVGSSCHGQLHEP